MISIVRNWLIWLELLCKTIYWFLRQIYHFNFKNQINYSCKDRSLAVLANGPSLNSELKNIDQFENFDICCVNDFALTDYFEYLKPPMYVLADPSFWIDDERYKEGRSKLYNKLLEVVKWSVTINVPFNSKKHLDLVKIFESNSYINVKFYHSVEWCGFPSMRNYIYKKGWAMPRAQNVIVPCMFIGINSGYQNIELYGVDHSWLEYTAVNRQNQVCLKDVHFYDNDVEMKPMYTLEGNIFKMHEILRAYANMFESYQILKRYADWRSVKIINCTQGSMIDAFERR